MTTTVRTEETTDAQTDTTTGEPRSTSESGGTSGGGGTAQGTDTEATTEAPEATDVADRQARRDDRWRERATAAEARADVLTRREVLRLLGVHVSDPEAALTLDGTDMADLLTEDGDVDDEAVAELSARVVLARPYLGRTSQHHGDIGPKRTVVVGKSATWGGLLKR